MKSPIAWKIALVIHQNAEMHLSDWKKHAAKVVERENVVPRMYSSAGSLKHHILEYNRAKMVPEQPQLGMLIERLQKDNDALVHKVEQSSLEVGDMTAQTEIMMEIMGEERAENFKLRQEIKKMVQFSSDAQLKTKMDNEIARLERENNKLRKENEELRGLYEASEEQSRQYQTTLVQMKAATAKTITPLSRQNSTTSLHQRLNNLKAEFAKKQAEYDNQDAERNRRTERLIMERDRLKQALEQAGETGGRTRSATENGAVVVSRGSSPNILKAKYYTEEKEAVANLNVYTEEIRRLNSDVSAYATKLRAAEEMIRSLKRVTLSSTPTKPSNVFLRLVGVAAFQNHSISSKAELIKELLQLFVPQVSPESSSLQDGSDASTVSDKHIFDILKASDLPFGNVLTAIGKIIKTATRCCKTSSASNVGGGDNAAPVSIDAVAATLLQESIICFHLFMNVENVADQVALDSFFDAMQHLAMSRLMLEGLNPNNVEWEWHTTMYEALTEAGVQCIDTLTKVTSDAVNYLFRLLLLRPQKSRLPGSPTRAKAGVDDGSNLPRFVSDILNGTVEMLNFDMEPLFGNYDLAALFTNMSKVYLGKRLAAIAAAEEILLFAAQSRTEDMIKMTHEILMAKPDTPEQSIPEDEKVLLLHARDVAIDCHRNHAKAKVLQRWFLKSKDDWYDPSFKETANGGASGPQGVNTAENIPLTAEEFRISEEQVRKKVLEVEKEYRLGNYKLLFDDIDESASGSVSISDIILALEQNSAKIKLLHLSDAGNPEKMSRGDLEDLFQSIKLSADQVVGFDELCIYLERYQELKRSINVYETVEERFV